MKLFNFNIRPAQLKYNDEECIYFPFFGFIKKGKWSDLEEVAIETTDKGPFFEDVYYLLNFNKTKIRIEQAISGNIVSKLQKLPNFNNEELIKSMLSTSNAIFILWKKSN